MLISFLALAALASMPAADTAASPLAKATCDDGWELRAASTPLEPIAISEPRGTPPFDQCGGIRPGARLSNGCTLNFVFTEGPRTFIGTAGHCTEIVGERVSAAGVGQFGTVVYRIEDGGSDFALVEIDEDLLHRVDPAVCTWGGPSGADPTGLAPPDALLEYGWGFATSITPQTRARIHVEALTTTNTIFWNGVGSGGDSGAPILTGHGYAAGIHTHGLLPLVPVGATLESGPTIGHILSLTSNAGFQLELVTAPTGSFQDDYDDLFP